MLLGLNCAWGGYKERISLDASSKSLLENFNWDGLFGQLPGIGKISFLNINVLNLFAFFFLLCFVHLVFPNKTL